jgi:DNA-binding NarL/FixJ family response regulator
MRLIVADDSGLFRDLLVQALTEAGHEVIGQTGRADDVVVMAVRQRPDVVLLDIRMPPSHTDDGLRAALRIRERRSDVGVVLLSNHGEVEYAMRLVQAVGDRVGYLLKERATGTGELLDTVERVAAGGVVIDPSIVARLLARHRLDNPLRGLTERELQILALMAEGRANSAIARTMMISLSTVEKHASAVFRKLHLAPAQVGLGGAGGAGPKDNARVLAVLTYLRHTGRLPPGPGAGPGA